VPGGRPRYVITRKEKMTPAQKMIYNDLFRAVS